LKAIHSAVSAVTEHQTLNDRIYKLALS